MSWASCIFNFVATGKSIPSGKFVASLLLCRRGRWAQASTETDTFEVVNLADWEQLMMFYGDDNTLSDQHPARRCAL